MSLLLIFVLTAGAFAHDVSTPYGWYCKKSTDGTLPRADAMFDFIKKYNCVYADEKAGDNKVIYLTFDAGYINENVIQILDTLKKHDVRGAFFVLENTIKRSPEVVKRMSDEGHLVCNHTAKHRDMTRIRNKEQFAAELQSMEKMYFELTGRDMAKFYRPPEGRFSEENLEFAQSLGYKTVLWSFAYADWDNSKQPDPERSKEKILSATHPGEIILLHPTSATNAQILDDVLCAWENDGYRFATLDMLP